MENVLKGIVVRHIHFVGIGGISMSALAKLCLHSGITVSGSDKNPTRITDELINLGVTFFKNHKKSNISGADLVVYTIAVGENNPEVEEARKNNILTMERSDFLEKLCENYKNVIAVSGTHGKTTTCGMLGSIFISAKLNPTVHMGGECEVIGGNLKIGENQFFITEACEYKRHFLKVPHDVGVILNIEEDHPDCYKKFSELHNAFDEFSTQSRKVVVINEEYKCLLNNLDKKQKITFNSKIGANFTAKKIRQFIRGAITFDCYKDGIFFANFEISCFGKHNVSNALASIAVADYYNVSTNHIWQGLKKFTGVKRRFQFIGKINNCPVIHDYAHHPTEIKTTISSTKEIFKKPVICVFQPHTYSRTKRLFSQFLTCFDGADKVLMLPTYASREKPLKNSNAKYLANGLILRKVKCTYCQSFSMVKKYLKSANDSIILIVGAGNIVDLAEEIKNSYLNSLNKF